MRRACTVILVVWLAFGCVSAPPPPEKLPTVTSNDYDLLWDATRHVVERHFELFVQRKDQGYMVSTYKRAEPVPDEGPKDAQTAYHTVEDLMHIVRRRLTARILEESQGLYVLHLEVIHERQGYVPPQSDYASHSLFDHRTTPLYEAADQTNTVTWHRLGRDMHLERTLLLRIQAYLRRHKRA